MSLISTFTVPSGVNIASLLNDSKVLNYVIDEAYTVLRGYVRVNQSSWEQNEVTFILDYKQNKDASTIMTKTFSFRADMAENAPNIHTQIYNYVKSLPEFEGAEDA